MKDKRESRGRFIKIRLVIGRSNANKINQNNVKIQPKTAFQKLLNGLLKDSSHIV